VSNSEDLVWLALNQLKKEKLIAGGLDPEYDHFNGMSRREAIRKVGFGSMVALPVVLSLVAPAATAAQTSACGPNLGEACSCEVEDPTCITGLLAPEATCGANCTQQAGPGCVCSGPFVWIACVELPPAGVFGTKRGTCMGA
jgi:hypothetical protein